MRDAGCLTRMAPSTAQRGAPHSSLPSSLSGPNLAPKLASVRARQAPGARRGYPCCAAAEVPEDFPSPLLPRRRRSTKEVRWQASVATATPDVCEPSRDAALAGATIEVEVSAKRGSPAESPRSAGSMTRDAAPATSDSSREPADSPPSSNTSRVTSSNGPPISEGPPSGDSSGDKAKYLWLQSRRYLYEDPPQKPIAEVDRQVAAGGLGEQAGPVIGPEEPPFETTFTVLAERLQLWRAADSPSGEGGMAGPGSRKSRRRRRGLAATGLIDAGPLVGAAPGSAKGELPPTQQRSGSRAGDALPCELLGSSFYSGSPGSSARAGMSSGSGAMAGTEDELESVNELGSSVFSFSSSPSLMRLSPSSSSSSASGNPAYRALVLGEPQVRDILNLSQPEKQRPGGVARGTRLPITPPPPPPSPHLRASSPGGGLKAQDRPRNAAGEAFCASQAVQDLLDVAAASWSPVAAPPPPKKAAEEGLLPAGLTEEVKRRRRRRSRVRPAVPGSATAGTQSQLSAKAAPGAGFGVAAPSGSLAAGSPARSTSARGPSPPGSPGRDPGAEPSTFSADRPEAACAADLGAAESVAFSYFPDSGGATSSDSSDGSAEEMRALGAEVRAFMAHRGLPLRMPTRKELRSDFEHGLPLEKWIQRAGGAYACSQRLGIPMAHTRRPKGYWQQAANLEKQVRDFQIEHGLPFSELPSRAVMVQKGRYDLARALERWGGHNDVAQMLGLGVRQKRPKGLTLAGKRRGTKAWKDPEGVLGTAAAAANAKGLGAEAREDGEGCDAAKERGGKGGPNMPVKACLPRTTKKWFTLNLSLEAPAPESELKAARDS